MCILKWLAASLVAVSLSTAARSQDIGWQKVDDVMGRKAAVTSDVHRYGFPAPTCQSRSTALRSNRRWRWAAGLRSSRRVMAMGDLVLLETEINPVMLKLIEGGLEITAVHNHVLRASPATFYMHVGGHGDPVKIAAVIRDALSASKPPLTAPAAGAPPPIDLDTEQLDQIIGVKGQNNGGVYQFNVPRGDSISEGGIQLTPVGPIESPRPSPIVQTLHENTKTDLVVETERDRGVRVMLTFGHKLPGPALAQIAGVPKRRRTDPAWSLNRGRPCELCNRKSGRKSL
ncbi:DUF1259 domain-containing protein [Bradyrhizobium sp. RDI18]|uniref:DUF1259 domain-containing protein n=1 Tax=Bradyrhizobium sp. RDI18 TaxID=3367400 RepID=UPI003716E7C5